MCIRDRVGAATLDDGVAKIRLDIEPKYRELIHEDAEFLLRPKTGLNDMVVEIDPGTEGPAPEEGATLPLAQGLSNVQLDQFFASLDADTQNYLALLLQGAGVGLDGKGEELSQALRRFGPFAEYTARINGELEKRRNDIKGGVHAFSQIATELGNNDEAVADFVTNSRRNLQAYADEEASLREALQAFPPTLAAAQTGLAKSNDLSLVLRPTLLGLIPGAKNLKGSLKALQSLAESQTPNVRDNIRPFTREVQPVFRDLEKTSKPAAVTTNQFRGVFTEFNNVFNLLAHNPEGDSQEGFLFWAPWMSHNMNSATNTQDAIGPVRRGLSTVNCDAASLGHTIASSVPQLLTAFRLAQLPPPLSPAQGGICLNPFLFPDYASLGGPTVTPTAVSGQQLGDDSGLSDDVGPTGPTGTTGVTGTDLTTGPTGATGGDAP